MSRTYAELGPVARLAGDLQALRRFPIAYGALQARHTRVIQFLHHGFLAITLALFHLVGPVPPDLGLQGGTLAPCPGPAHCARADWSVANPDTALEVLTAALATMPRTEIVERRGGYVHAIASSALFGFVDDLELYADHDRGMVQARSVSRLGDSDLGVNGRRLELLQRALGETR